MQEIIKVDSLSKTFGKLQAVSDLSFTVNKGDVYGFLGQNGAGKSTTMRMLLTLIKPTHGSIEIFGKQLQKEPKAILSQIGCMIEKPDLYKYLSAYDNLKIFARLSGVNLSKKDLLKQLQAVGLGERASSKVKTFSQGMKQRLGIAIALAHNPQLVVLDEPTNGLDPQGILEIRNLIKQLSDEQGKTVLVSSHLLTEIEQVATKILIIHKGKKIVEDSKAALLNPNQTIVAVDTNDNITTLKILQQTGWAKTINNNAINLIELTIPKNDIPQLVQYLTQQNVQLYSLQQRHSLEDYFIKVTH